VDRFIVVGERAVEIALQLVSVAATVESEGVFRIEPNGLVVVGKRAVEIALFLVDIGAADKARAYLGSNRIASL